MRRRIAAVIAEQHVAIDASLARASRSLDAGDLATAWVELTALVTGIRHHIAVEDEHVFPIYEHLTGADPTVAQQMRDEHRGIERLGEKMEAAAAAADRATIMRVKADLHAALGLHDEHEEKLCAVLDARLKPAQRAALIAVLSR